MRDLRLKFSDISTTTRLLTTLQPTPLCPLTAHPLGGQARVERNKYVTSTLLTDVLKNYAAFFCLRNCMTSQSV